MKTKRFFKKINAYLNQDIIELVEDIFDSKYCIERPLRLKIFNLENMIFILFCLGNIAVNVLLNYKSSFIIFNLVIIAFCFLITRCTNKCKQVNRNIYIFTFVYNIIMIPLFQIITKGYFNNINNYFLMGFIFNFILIENRNYKKLCFLTIQTLVYVCIYLLNYNNIHSSSYFYYLLDTLVLSTCIGFNFITILRMELNQRKKILSINKYLKKISVIDPLTGVWNRKYMEEKLNEELDKKEEVSIIMLDIDNFKDVNDTYGHQVGDYILRKFSYIITSNIRDDDVLSRYGGEEFLVILPNTNRIAAYRIAVRIRKEISKKLFIDNTDKTITVSGGIASSKNINCIEELISVADKNLYEAKSKGKNKII